MSVLYNYSPEDVDVLIGGVYRLSGFSDGTLVRISKDKPAFSVHESSDGVVSRTHSGSSLYSVSVVLHSTAQDNQVLTYLHTADTFSKIAKFPIIIRDRLGTSNFFSPDTWIEGHPDSDYSTSITDRVWNFRCGNSSNNIGGNASSAGFIRSLADIGLGYLDAAFTERIRG